MSSFGKLNKGDFWRGLVTFMFTAILTYLANLTTITNLDPEQIASIALVSMAGYLLKNLTTTADGKALGVL